MRASAHSVPVAITEQSVRYHLRRDLYYCSSIRSILDSHVTIRAAVNTAASAVYRSRNSIDVAASTAIDSAVDRDGSRLRRSDYCSTASSFLLAASYDD